MIKIDQGMNSVECSQGSDDGPTDWRSNIWVFKWKKFYVEKNVQVSELFSNDLDLKAT